MRSRPTKASAARRRGETQGIPAGEGADGRRAGPSDGSNANSLYAWQRPDPLIELESAVAAFPAAVSQRGRQYAFTGHVKRVDYDTRGAHATVRGTRNYDTCWHWAGQAWTPSCSCPVAPRCKHTVAVACVILADAELDFDPGAAAPREAVIPAITPPASRQRSVESRASAVPASRDARALERLRSSRDPWERLLALSELVAGLPDVEQAVFDEPYSDLVTDPDPDLRCWVVARTIAAQTGGRIPRVLVPFIERTDLEHAHRARTERVLTNGITAWARGPRLRAARQLRFEFHLVEAGRAQADVTLVVRLTSARLRDEARTGAQLRQLEAEVRRDPGLLASDQLELLALLVDPAVAPSIGEYDSSFVLAGAALVRVLLTVSDSPLATWSAALPSHLAARAGLEPGGAVRLAAGTVSIGPALVPGLRSQPGGATKRPRVTLEYLLPDGRALREDELLILPGWSAGPLRQPTLVLADAAFRMTRGGPPAEFAGLIADTGGLELTAENAATISEALARISPRFAASLATHTRLHDVRPAVSIELRADDWLQVRAFAIGIPCWRPGESVPAGASLFEWTPDGRWMACTAEPFDRDAESPSRDMAAMLPIAAAPEIEAAPLSTELTPSTAAPREPGDDIWLELPDPARVAPLVAWLAAAGLSSGGVPGPGDVHAEVGEPAAGAWLKLGPRTCEQFADAWNARPAGVEWYGNPAARRLLQPSVQHAPRVRVAASGVDWFTVSAEWEADGLALTDAELAKLRGAGTQFVRLPTGWARKDQAVALDAVAETFAELGIEPGAADQRVSLWQLAHARPEALDALVALASRAGQPAGDGGAGPTEALDAMRALRKQVAAFKGLPRVPVPRGIKARLRSYQRDGLDFLAHTSSLGLGAILADDMGLGKTLQALAWLSCLGERDPDAGPSLVVCPTSVLHLWVREAQRFAPKLRVQAMTAGEDRHALRRDIPKHDLVVTSYALLRRDLDELKSVAWRAVILDEAQNVKNPDALVSRAARELNARHRLAVTGTPLENRALDLWSIMAFVNPGYLGTRASFARRFDDAEAPPHARRLLAAKLRPVMLRRLKVLVAPELPERIEERRDCELTTGQRKLYLAELARGRSVLARLAGAGGVERHKISILAVLTKLRQICCHPELGGGRAELGSGKFDAFFELLEPLFAEGHKVLVFSQFVECLKLIAVEMQARGLAHHLLTGASRRREELVADFERDTGPCAFLISLKAGGTGLNLTAASYVVLFDPWWNPAVEAQAIDRTHRIGQDRTVIAYRMLARGTIEERIWDLQQRKASMVRDVLGEDGFARTLSREDLDYLLADI